LAAIKRRTVCVLGVGIGDGSTEAPSWWALCVSLALGCPFRIDCHDMRRKNEFMVYVRYRRIWVGQDGDDKRQQIVSQSKPLNFGD
jgi:hypothetical protein